MNDGAWQTVYEYGLRAKGSRHGQADPLGAIYRALAGHRAPHGYDRFGNRCRGGLLRTAARGGARHDAHRPLVYAWGPLCRGAGAKPAPTAHRRTGAGAIRRSPGLLVRSGVGALCGGAGDASDPDRPHCCPVALVDGWNVLCGTGAPGPLVDVRAPTTELLRWPRVGAGWPIQPGA